MRTTKYRYWVIFMVLLIMTINYIDRGALAYAQQDIIEEFGFTPAQWGSIQGFFGYGYIFGGLFGGVLADKKGPRFVWLTFVTIWSIFVALTAYAGNLGIAIFGGSAMAGFFVVRALFGFAEGPSFVSMSRTLANWVAPKERTFTASITLIGTPLGSVITAPIAVFLISMFNWKISFLMLGFLGLIWVLVFSRIFTNLPEENPRVSKEELAEIRQGETSKVVATAQEAKNFHWYDFFKNSSYLFNTVGFFAISYIIFMLLTWTPKYLQDVYGMSLKSLWYLGMIPWLGPIFSTPFGGKIADLIFKKTKNLRIARNSVAMASLLLSGVCFILIPTVNSMTGALTFMALGNTAALASNSIYWSNLIDIDPTRTGAFGGIMHFLGQTAAMLAPTITGIMVTNYGYNAGFVLAGTICLIGVICAFFVKFKKEEIDVSV
ncbi:MFS transporter [Megasphaera paucivorans]|uniref:Sugar phosphate permease n=1 Tax=Megasphaera paucivorans TaxID=349095 RepID=A0A1G9YPE1_9FIRM|nr:MFS transporter [Megasphaera paucivorans]SDN11058.1 Sugar phosphate permease [Megasphaera paucivorans]